VLEQLSLLDVVDLLPSVSLPADTTRFEDVERRGLLPLHAQLRVFLVVLTHGDVSQCLPLSAGQFAEEGAFVDKCLVFVVGGRNHIFHCVLEGAAVDVPQKTDSFGPDRGRPRGIEQQSKFSEASVERTHPLLDLTVDLNCHFAFVEEEEAAGVVALLDEVLSLVDLAEAEAVDEFVANGVLEVGEGEVPHEAVGDDFAVVGLLLPVDFGEGLVNHLLIVVLDRCQLSQLSPLIVVALLGVASLAVQLEIAERAQQSHFLAHQIFHFDYATTATAPIFNPPTIPLLSNLD
jgi:hypothetical protein